MWGWAKRAWVKDEGWLSKAQDEGKSNTSIDVLTQPDVSALLRKMRETMSTPPQPAHPIPRVDSGDDCPAPTYDDALVCALLVALDGAQSCMESTGACRCCCTYWAEVGHAVDALRFQTVKVDVVFGSTSETVGPIYGQVT